MILSGGILGFGVQDSAGHHAASPHGTFFHLASESPTCAGINGNSSLANSYSGFYYSLANNSPSFWQGGINSTPPVHQSGYRNASAGSQMVIQDWISICGSPAYSSLYSQWGPSSVVSGSELEANGHYVFS